MTEPSFDRLELADLPQKHFAIAMRILGADNRDVLKAQEKAAQVQALLIVKDKLLEKSIPSVGDRKNALFDWLNTHKTPEALRRDLGTKATDRKIAAARAEVDAKKGLAKAHPAVPPYGAIISRFLDKDFMQGALHMQVGLRILNLLQDESINYTMANANKKRDTKELYDASGKLNELRDLRNTPEFPSDMEKAPYWDAAEHVLRKSYELMGKKYPSETQALKKGLKQAYKDPEPSRPEEAPKADQGKDSPAP